MGSGYGDWLNNYIGGRSSRHDREDGAGEKVGQGVTC